MHFLHQKYRSNKKNILRRRFVRNALFNDLKKKKNQSCHSCNGFYLLMSSKKAKCKASIWTSTNRMRCILKRSLKFCTSYYFNYQVTNLTEIRHLLQWLLMQIYYFLQSVTTTTTTTTKTTRTTTRTTFKLIERDAHVENNSSSSSIKKTIL